MSLLLFSGVSSLAATTEELESKCQGTSGCGSYWPGMGLHLHYICGMDLRQTVVPLGIPNPLLLNGGFSQEEAITGEIKDQTDQGESDSETPKRRLKNKKQRSSFRSFPPWPQTQRPAAIRKLTVTWKE